jgi:hypothetical protein
VRGTVSVRACCLILASVVVTVLVLPASTAATVQGEDVLYVDVGLDPDDVPIDEGSCCQQDPDIRSTRRRVFIDDGRRLFVNFHTSEPLLGYWKVVVRLDTRGGPRSDARMRIFDDGAGSAGCTVRFGSGPRREGEYHAPNFGDRASCEVPLKWVRQNKRIRWKLVSRAGVEGTEPGVDEFAPDRGWYP